MPSVVSVRKCDDYKKASIKDCIGKILEDLGDISEFVKPDDRVLLKPNLLMSAKPEKAIVTHPLVVEAIAEMVIAAGGKPWIGDSPPVGKLNRVLSKSGYSEFMDRLGIESAPFLEKRTVEYQDGRLYKRIDLAEEVFGFDKLINIAKLKTHCQMLLTLSVKNLFGCIIGTDKAQWHLRGGKDYETFATVLVQIYEKIRPCLNIVDGVLGMEGKGPNNGTPRKMGILAASQDGVALDAVLCDLVGMPLEDFLTCRIGHGFGIGNSDLNSIEIRGDELKGFPLKDFEAPAAMTIKWNLSEGNPLRRFLERYAMITPDILASKCEGCGICKAHCPPQAIYEKNGVMSVDRQKCISCFCCHELCERDAIRIKEPLLVKIMSKVSR